MAGFCPNCGKPVDDGTAFCGGCGAKIGDSSPVAATPAVPAHPVPAPATTQMQPAAKTGGGCGKTVVIIAVVLVLLLVAGFAGFAYLAYRAKKKIDEVHHAIKQGDLDKVAGALGGKEVGGKDAEAMPDFPEYSGGTTTGTASEAAKSTDGGKPVSGELALGSVVPMKKGLRITTAIQQSRGDYESMKAIKSVTADAVTMEYSADVPEAQNPFDDEKKKAEPPKLQSVRGGRRILRQDLQNAHEYAEHFGESIPMTIPNTTALGISASVLNELKTKGESQFTYQAVGLKGALGGLLGGLGGMPGGVGNIPGQDQKAQEALKELQNISKVNCTLKRVDHKTYSFPVLVNGTRTQLPAIRAKCKTDDEDEDAEFYFLDDPQNPLSLTWKLGASDRLQVIKLEYVVEAPANAASAASDSSTSTSGPSKDMEEKLEKKEKVQIYGIYFDFNSDKIKPESKPTLDEIAGVMKAHPDWKLNVDGHTDNIGTDASNLDLSQRRAAAVKDALVTTYHITADRLDTSGHGASQPVETNATMEGRARNRRVELSRE